MALHATIDSLQRSVGNAAVTALLRRPPLDCAPPLGFDARPASRRPPVALRPHVVNRTWDSDVVAAINYKSRNPFAGAGDFEKAWGILNHLNMADMLTTMESLHTSGNLATLLKHMDATKKLNVGRLLLGVHSVQLKRAGVDAAGLARIATEIAVAGDQADAVERYLGSGPAGAAGPLTGAGDPDAAAIAKVGAALNPASTSATGAAVAWDGDGPTPAHKAKAKSLKHDLTAALKAHLDRVMPLMRKKSKAPKLAMAKIEGAGKQSKRVVDDVFGSLTSAAALTSGQHAGRAAFSYTAGVNLFDQTNPAHYKRDAEDCANWMAETDRAASAAQLGQHFDKRRPVEAAFLNDQVLAPFVRLRKADLELYDAFGFATANPETHTVNTTPQIMGDNKPSKAGVPAPGERQLLWHEWQTLVHEYIHTLEHPAFGEAAQGRRAMKEGFCEMLTKAVLTKYIPLAQADGDAALRIGVEGSDPSGKAFPDFDAKFVPNYSSRAYAQYVVQAEAVQAATSPEAVRAAFFLGHVELIGLQPDGDLLTAPGAGASPSGPAITPPTGITTVFALATITRTSSSSILAANAGLKVDGSLPASVVVPGVRLHRVVESKETTPTGRALDKHSETGAEIAALYGLAVDDVMRANPTITNWTSLAPGVTILIPAR